jgi:hypothetical protein
MPLGFGPDNEADAATAELATAGPDTAGTDAGTDLPGLADSVERAQLTASTSGRPDNDIATLAANDLGVMRSPRIRQVRVSLA